MIVEQGCIVVGQSIVHDLRCLGLLREIEYEGTEIDGVQYVDTACWSAVSRKKESLRSLAKSQLGISIQGGHHDSVEDALATMAVFNKNKDFYVKCLAKESLSPTIPKRRPKKKSKRSDQPENKRTEKLEKPIC